MMQIYGIDLASEKFDVVFVNEKGKEVHKIVKNTQSQIDKFLDTLPEDALLVAEYTGVYGDMLLYLSSARGIKMSLVSGYTIKHSAGMVKGKSDKADARMIREYGVRNADKLNIVVFPSDAMYQLQELFATRRLLVKQRKQIYAVQKGDKKRPLANDKAAEIKNLMVEHLSDCISKLEQEIQEIIDADPALHKSSEIVQSVTGVGPVTSSMLIIKTGNFLRITTAPKCSSLIGIAPFPNSTGKCDKGNHVSDKGDKELKSLMFMCAQSAVMHNESIRVYKTKKYDIEKKPYFLVMNNIANKLIKTIFALIKSGKNFDPNYIPRDPRLKVAEVN